jgi:hypothetical protein
MEDDLRQLRQWTVEANQYKMAIESEQREIAQTKHYSFKFSTLSPLYTSTIQFCIHRGSSRATFNEFKAIFR